MAQLVELWGAGFLKADSSKRVMKSWRPTRNGPVTRETFLPAANYSIINC